MDYEFLSVFQPKIVDVCDRKEAFWELKNYEIDREKTQRHVLAYVYDGEGIMDLNGSRYALRSGTVFYIPPESQMKIKTQLKTPLRFYSVIFQYGQLRWAGESVQWSHDLKSPLPMKALTYFEVNPGLLDLCTHLFMTWNRKGIGYEWKAKLQFQQLLDLLAQMVRYASEHIKRNVAIIEETIDYIREHLREQLDRHALADRVSLSAGHFTTLFKQHTGYALTEFVTRLRLDRAKQLLRETDMPIYKISEDVGYADSFYFTRLFGKETGMSPREFRQGCT